jgi:hypothetical protein
MKNTQMEMMGLASSHIRGVIMWSCRNNSILAVRKRFNLKLCSLCVFALLRHSSILQANRYKKLSCLLSSCTIVENESVFNELSGLLVLYILLVELKWALQKEW